MLTRTGMILAAVVLVSCVNAADPKRELELMQGTWVIVSAEMGGEKVEGFKDAKLIIDKDSYAVTVGGQKDKGVLNLDPSQSPRAMDIVGREGPNKGKTFPAIYELRDESMKICYALDGTKRPTEFSSKGDKKLFLVHYKRQK